MSISSAWPHQTAAVQEILRAIEDGARRILVTLPTGMGKTWIMREIAKRRVLNGRKVVIYSNRRLLIEQTARTLEEDGFTYGVRSAGHKPELDILLQVSSIQTENARAIKRRRWTLHDATMALVDEAHVMKEGAAVTVMNVHVENDAVVIGFTATPIGLGELYDELICTGRVSDGRACGALVPAIHYGCDEPSLSKFDQATLDSGADLSERRTADAIMKPGIYGRVFEWYRRLNPCGKPTILFAPGVKESLWFAEEFEKRGVPAAHIDGQEIWIRGSRCQTSPSARKDLLEASRNGDVKVVCNRFVLREGIDAPWLAHGIFATVFGSLQSYLQSGGRLLRSHPGLQSVTIQDHGGNWWRHGSLNDDRDWELDFTDSAAAGLRREELNTGVKPKPFCCPGCSTVLIYTLDVKDGIGTCPQCKCTFDFRKRSRPVVMSDGVLVQHQGDDYFPTRKRKERHNPNTQELWTRIYWRMRNANRTFRQAMALFVHENYYDAPQDLDFMPTRTVDWFYKIKKVPYRRLRLPPDFKGKRT